jgi:hypothetical protein
LIYSDVWGPASVLSTTARDYVIFLDDCTRFLWIFPMKFKSDVQSIFHQFQTFVERQFNSTIKSIQIDCWGGGDIADYPITSNRVA